MDNSRNVLQAPADSSISGRISSQSIKQERDRLLTQLLFAARDLASKQFSHKQGTQEKVCIECRSIQRTPDFLDHTEQCCTGRVRRALADLLALPEHDHSYERSASRNISIEPADAGVKERPRLLPAIALCGEPWSVSESGEVRDSRGVLIVDPFGSELPAGAELPYMQRIVDQVTALWFHLALVWIGIILLAVWILNRLIADEIDHARKSAKGGGR